MFFRIAADDQSFVDVWDDTSTCYGGLDHRVQLFITTDSELQMPRSDSFGLEVLRSVPCKLKNFCSEVFKNGCSVNCRCASDSAVTVHPTLHEAVDSSHRKLQTSSSRSWLRSLFIGLAWPIFTTFPAFTFASGQVELFFHLFLLLLTNLS